MFVFIGVQNYSGWLHVFAKSPYEKCNLILTFVLISNNAKMQRGRTAKTSSPDMPRRVSESSSFYSKCPVQLPCFINERLNELREFKWPASEFILGKELDSHRSFAPGELPHSALLCSDICGSQDSGKIVHPVQPEPKGFHQCSAWPPG